MNPRPHKLAERYTAALGRYLADPAKTGLEPALRLGRQAVGLGLETLELARIHEQSVRHAARSDTGRGLARRAERFFAEAIAQIVDTHRAARQSRNDLSRLNDTLQRRTAELAATNLQLKRGITRRRTVETALKTAAKHYSRLLKDSVRLQEGLRHLTHQVLAAQEEERKKISQELQNEIAQTLLGLNARLLSLKAKARTNRTGLKKEIASTQRLVVESVLSVRRVARDFRNP